VLVNPDTCIGCKLCSWACPYGAREYDHDDGVMKKCTLCVDRIYNETCPRRTGEPACVRACPTGARAFGDLGDPLSAVSLKVADRGGFDLLPDFGYKPVNKYLPPRAAASSVRGDRARRRPSAHRATGSSVFSPGSTRSSATETTMHPAYSVIFFTTASGAGYGLWFWLGLRIAAEGLPDPAWPGVATLVLGGVLVSLGLLSSTFHLGHPERAWRAFSQWRSSWLSREGVAAVATYLPAGALFLALVLPGRRSRRPRRRGLSRCGIRGNGLVHGNDLCRAAHRAGMEPSAGAGDLPGPCRGAREGSSFAHRTRSSVTMRHTC
jgi:ferredoxin